MDTIFDKQGFTDDYEQDLYQNCAGLEFKNWLFFLYLKQNIDNIRNTYLQYVLSVTDCYENLKDNILTEIIRISKKDKRFYTYYDDRKRLIRDFPEADIAIFIHENGWEFLFLGANIDAAAEARRFGISADRAVNYKCDEEGTALNYEVISEAVCSVRACRPLNADWKKRIDEDVRKRSK